MPYKVEEKWYEVLNSLLNVEVEDGFTVTVSDDGLCLEIKPNNPGEIKKLESQLNGHISNPEKFVAYAITKQEKLAQQNDEPLPELKKDTIDFKSLNPGEFIQKVLGEKFLDLIGLTGITWESDPKYPGVSKNTIKNRFLRDMRSTQMKAVDCVLRKASVDQLKAFVTGSLDAGRHYSLVKKLSISDEIEDGPLAKIKIISVDKAKEGEVTTTIDECVLYQSLFPSEVQYIPDAQQQQRLTISMAHLNQYLVVAFKSGFAIQRNPDQFDSARPWVFTPNSEVFARENHYVFLLDASASMTNVFKSYIAQVQVFIKTLKSVDKSNAQCKVMCFSEKIYDSLEFNLQDQASMDKAFATMRSWSIKTITRLSFALAETINSVHSSGDNAINNVIILFTDGRDEGYSNSFKKADTDQLEKALASCKVMENPARVYAIGAGDADRVFLQKIANLTESPMCFIKDLHRIFESLSQNIKSMAIPQDIFTFLIEQQEIRVVARHGQPSTTTDYPIKLLEGSASVTKGSEVFEISANQKAGKKVKPEESDLLSSSNTRDLLSFSPAMTLITGPKSEGSNDASQSDASQSDASESEVALTKVRLGGRNS